MGLSRTFDGRVSSHGRVRTAHVVLGPSRHTHHRLHTARLFGATSLTVAASPAAGRRPAAHARDHLASRRGQDHADRKAAAVRRRDPSGRRGQGQGRAAAGALGLDEDRAAARHLGHDLGHDLRVWRLHLQPARHAGPRGFQRGHLPHADRGRFGDHGARRRQGHRAADLQAVRGLPPARHPDHDPGQQDGSRGARSDRAARRDPRPAGARHRAHELADRHGPELPGRLRPGRPQLRAAGPRARAGIGGGGRRARQQPGDPRARGAARGAARAARLWSRERCRPSRSRATARAISRRCSSAARCAISASAPCSTALAALRARRRGRSRPTSAPSSPARTRSRASCSRSRRTWTPSTATASPSCGCARAASSAA